MPRRGTNRFFTHLVLLCGVVFFACDVQAASLFGRVIEVQSGDVITIFNLNRPVRVKLLGVDAPEMDQAFGDVAKKHLSDLVSDQSVQVEYSGISADGSIAGRVLLNSTDIGAQMIRDGAAWFDPNNQTQLSATDREVYQQSEQAARGEHRGLWQAENPTAPWEFVKLKALRRNPTARLNAIAPLNEPQANRPVPELTNLSLMRSAASSAGSDEPSAADLMRAMGATPKSWQQFRPAGEDFSILAPDQGLHKTVQEDAGDRMVDVHSYLVRDGWATYVVTWLKGPTHGRTEDSALEEALQGILKGGREGLEKRGQEAFSCGAMPKRNISMNGYAGREFDLTSCTLPMKVRVYIRVNGEDTQMYMAAAMFAEEDENVTRFLKSFTVGSAQSIQRLHRLN
ncbi:MAG TPA: thermonuclease family protein [Pyrinomonadaceae bacterium]|nr:thermonuclease family protein [Pyrinomonadaceae bacterium]